MYVYIYIYTHVYRYVYIYVYNMFGLRHSMPHEVQLRNSGKRYHASSGIPDSN